MKLIMLVGPAGSGKSTLAKQFADEGYTYVNQDKHGKEGHLTIFNNAIWKRESVVIDRMNFTKQQRDRYLSYAKENGYNTRIIVLHESYSTCLERCKARMDHETVKNEADARSALNMFFSKYERVEDGEADEVKRIWPDNNKPKAVICDLDGTLCNIDHRLHYVRTTEGQKKDWKGFFGSIENDIPNRWCVEILDGMSKMNYPIVYCSGRPDDHKRSTKAWLETHGLLKFWSDTQLYMRLRGDYRQDNIVKEIILDFEILTRYEPYFVIDDRKQVVDMWRKRGYVCLQCNEGDF